MLSKLVRKHYIKNFTPWYRWSFLLKRIIKTIAARLVQLKRKTRVSIIIHSWKMLLGTESVVSSCLTKQLYLMIIFLTYDDWLVYSSTLNDCKYSAEEQCQQILQGCHLASNSETTVGYQTITQQWEREWQLGAVRSASALQLDSRSGGLNNVSKPADCCWLFSSLSKVSES